MRKFKGSALRGVLLALGVLLGVAACSDPKEEALAQKLQTTPELVEIGTFDGCTVKYVNRYYRDRSFYLARCQDTATLTQQYTESQGKTQVARTRVQITQEIARLEQEREVLDKKESALKKLTVAERQALGLDPANDAAK